MNYSRNRRHVGFFALAVLAPALACGQTTATHHPPTGTTTAKPILPDPILLNGSAQPVEKTNELGMIGEFELPGDENARSGRVGGPQTQPAPSVGRGSVQAVGLPGGLAGAAQQQNHQGGGLSPALPSRPQQASGNSGVGQSDAGSGQSVIMRGGAESPNAAGNPLAGAADASAQPVGTPVAELGGTSDQRGGNAGRTDGGKPPPIQIGDKRMRIDTPGASPITVGAQVQGPNANTQIYEKPTGTGGKAPTSSQGPSRVEKGRVMPAGL